MVSTSALRTWSWVSADLPNTSLVLRFTRLGFNHFYVSKSYGRNMIISSMKETEIFHTKPGA